MAYTKYSLTPANNNAAPPDGAPEGMLPSAVNDTMRDMMSQIRDAGDGIRNGTYTMTAPVITGGSISGSTMSSNVITGGSINNTPIGGTTRAAGSFTTVTTTNDASISGLTVGKGSGSQASNTAVGNAALNGNSGTASGGGNSAFGQASLYNLTSGVSNTAIGYQAALATTAGFYNTAVGSQALLSNTTASNNTAVGYQAGYSNTTGTGITAIGYTALYSNTTGSSNTAIGLQALLYNTTASANTAVGQSALQNNTTGTSNAAVGNNALISNTTGNYNVAFGMQALNLNTTASNNTAVGYRALTNSTTAASNTAVGYQAGLGNTTGTQNTYVGVNSVGYEVTTGSKNTIIGGFSGNQGGLDIRTASNYIVLSDGDGNPRQVIDSSGNVGIGTIPSAWSTFKGVNAGAVGSFVSGNFSSGNIQTLTASNLYFDGAVYRYIVTDTASYYNQSNGSHIWYNAPSGTAGTTATVSERMRIDSSGNVGIGTSSPSATLNVNGPAQFTGGGTFPASGSGIEISGVVSGGTNRIQAYNRTGSTWQNLEINAAQTVFGTGGTERMRIDSSGNVGIGTSSPASTSGRNLTIGGIEPSLVLNASSNRSYSIASGGNFQYTPSSLVFYDNTANAERMRIDSGGELILIGSTAQKATGTTWSNPSDVRLKDNIQDYTKGLPELMQVKVKTWNYNGKGGTIEGTKGLGVVADEIKEILPDTVDNYKAKLNADDAEDTEIKKFDATEITWLMLKSIQELKAELDSVKAELQTLKGN